MTTKAGPKIDLAIADVADAYYGAIPRIMDDSAATVEVDVEHAAMPR